MWTAFYFLTHFSEVTEWERISNKYWYFHKVYTLVIKTKTRNILGIPFKDVGSSYSNLVQLSLWNNSTDTCLGIQIWI